MSAPFITLLTDFGLTDAYVASMKGVILSVCPEARIIDITHLAPPQDVRAGAFLLASAYHHFPPGTIHLVIIDPGVGTPRRGLVIEADRHFFVGPDNGLFSWVLQNTSSWNAHSVENPAYWRPTVSKTFHGRDIFAPAAGHLAMGLPACALGPPCTPLTAPWADAVATEAGIRGEIIHIDHFGNAITNVSYEMIERFEPRSRIVVMIGGLSISTIVDTYGDREPGMVIALIGSTRHLEVAVAQGSAAEAFGLHCGDPVTIVRA